MNDRQLYRLAAGIAVAVTWLVIGAAILLHESPS